MIAGIAFLILSPQSQLPLVDLGGVKTPVVIPTWKPDPVQGSVLLAGGWNYRFVEGKLVGRSRGNGDWDELADLGGKAVADATIKWPIKFFVSASLDQVGKTKYGFWMPRKYSIDGDDLRGLRRETALFTYMARAYSGGRIEVQPDFEVDNESVFAEPGQGPEDVLLESLKPRLITSKPFRSCFAITSALEYRTPAQMIGRVPTTYIPFFAAYDPSRPGAFARALFGAWIEQIQASAESRGYRISSPRARWAEPGLDRILPFVRDPEDAIRGSAMWQSLGSDSAGDDASHHPSASGSHLWSEVSDDPWTKLPILDKAGEKAVETESGLTVGDLKFDFDVRGSVLMGGKLYVQDRYADLFASKLGSRKALGFFPASGHVIVVFEGTDLAGSDSQVLGEAGTPLPVPGAVEKTSLPFDAKEAEGLAVTGYFEAKTAVDSDRGAVGDLRTPPRPGHGGVRLLGDGTARTIFDSAKTPLLQFWIKTGASAPLELIVDGKRTRHYRLLGRPTPFGPDVIDGVALNVLPDGNWQQVTILLNDGKSSEADPVHNVYLACPADAYYWSPTSQSLSVLMDDLRVTALPASGAGTVTPTRSTDVPAIAEAQDSWSRAAWAANVGDNPETLRSLLADKDGLVAFNALLKFGTSKDPAAIPTLIAAARTFSPRIDRLAFAALAAQESDEGWTAIRKAVTQGPFDLNKREASRIIVDHTKESKLAGEISLLFVSQSWQTRREAAIALSKVDGKAAKIVSLSFINGSEPAVRAASIRVADTSVNEVVDRLMSVIDPLSEPSDYIRALAAAKLVGADKEKAAMAWKSLEKDAPEAVVEFLNVLPVKAEYRDQVAALQNNADAGVKAAAARWLAKTAEALEDSVFLSRNNRNASAMPVFAGLVPSWERMISNR